MSPTQIQPKRDMINNSHDPLRIEKDSHVIKKKSLSYSSTCSSSSSSSLKQQKKQRPLIIYTHSPKVVQTNPRDFMAVVQKLTGLSRSSQPEKEDQGDDVDEEKNDHNKVLSNEDKEETWSSYRLHDVNPNYVTVFTPSSADFTMCFN